MSSGADRFFDEMLVSATRIAKRDVADEVKKLKSELATQKKLRLLAEKATKNVVRREATVQRKELALNKRDKREVGSLVDREKRVVQAEKELVALLNQIDAITAEDVVTTVTTVKARQFVSRSTTGYGYYKYPSINSASLSNIKRRINKVEKDAA